MIPPALAAAADPLLDATGNVLLSQGVLGVAVVGLVYYVFVLRRDIKDLTTAYEAKLAAKDKALLDSQESRITENRTGFDAVRAVQSSLDAFSVALRSK